MSSSVTKEFVIEDPYANEIEDEVKPHDDNVVCVYPKHPPLAVRYHYNSTKTPRQEESNIEFDIPTQSHSQQGQCRVSRGPAPGEDIETAFSDMVVNQPSEESNITVVLDCANIGWSYGHDVFLAEGVAKAIDYFEAMHIKTVGFLPLSYVRKKPYAHSSPYYDKAGGGIGGGIDSNNGVGKKGRSVKGHYDQNALMDTEDLSLLEQMSRDNRISLVPSGDYDDSYILSYARENNAFVVSNDMFMDHLKHIENPSIRKSMSMWLRVNRCSYSFVKGEFMLNPKW